MCISRITVQHVTCCIVELWFINMGFYFRFHCLPIFLSLSTFLSICLPIYVCIYLSVCLSIYLSIYLSICLCMYLSIYLSVCLSVCLSIYLYICLSVYVCIYLSVCLSVRRPSVRPSACLAVYPFIYQWSLASLICRSIRPVCVYFCVSVRMSISINLIFCLSFLVFCLLFIPFCLSFKRYSSPSFLYIPVSFFLCLSVILFLKPRIKIHALFLLQSL
jgi:hypothetical protein